MYMRNKSRILEPQTQTLTGNKWAVILHHSVEERFLQSPEASPVKVEGDAARVS